MNAIPTPWPERVLLIEGAPDLSWFTDDELAAATAFKLAKRRDEWLLARMAAKGLAVQRGIAADPRRIGIERPYVLVDGAPTHWQVSISHSAPYAGAAIDAGPVGIDVQVVREIAEWSSHLFLSDDETRAMQRCTIRHRLLHFWCAKEAAWKQRSHEFATMKQAPLRVVEERWSGLLFDVVETVVTGEVIVAVTV